jgi:hypothetical protein
VIALSGGRDSGWMFGQLEEKGWIMRSFLANETGIRSIDPQ